MTGWTLTKPLNVARASHTATALANGKVLAFGGYDFVNVTGGEMANALASAEIFDPGTLAWTFTGSAFYARSLHTATLLRNGKVLMAGGMIDNGSTELYDPSTGQFYATGRLNKSRRGHAAVLLTDGKVLVIGGSLDNPNVSSPYGWSNTAEIYDPTSETWTLTGDLKSARFSPTATVLLDGTVLVVGGTNPELQDRTTEIFNPANGTWTTTGSPFYARNYHSATLLPGGKVVVAGGRGYVPPGTIFDVAPSLTETELYDPASGNWYSVGRLHIGRSDHRATAIDDGTVLVTGGLDHAPAERNDVIDSVESFDPHTLVWTVAGQLNTARWQHTATPFVERSANPRLGASSVLVAGGAVNEVLGSAESRDIRPPVTIESSSR